MFTHHRSLAASSYISAANQLAGATDDEARLVLKSFILDYGIEVFRECHEKILFPIGKSTNSGSVVTATLLAAACYYRLTGLVKDIISHGVSLEAGTQSSNGELDQMSPLGIAVSQRSIDIVRELLSHDVNLLHVNRVGKPVFVHCPSEAIVDLILRAAKEKNCLDELLVKRHKIKNIDFFIYSCHAHDAAVLASLIKLPDIERYTDITKLISSTRWAAISFPEHYDLFTRITEKLLHRYPQADVCNPVIEYSPNEKISSANVVSTVEESHHFLFGVTLDVCAPPDRDAALKLANAQFYLLLNHLDRCLPYLRFLNKDFEAYVAVKTGGGKISDVDPSQFTFKVIDGIYYPIPHADSAFADHEGRHPYHKKNSALQEFLLLLFKKHGLGAHAMKWVGHVPQRFADLSVAAGDLTFDSKYSGASLLHGKDIHAIQTALLIYGIEAGEIAIDYLKDGVWQKLTVRDILASQVTLKSRHFENAPLWEDVRDKRCLTRVTGYDAHHFSSFIMKHGAELGFPSLANYMIDRFCKGIFKYYAAIKSHIPQIGSFEDFYAKYSRLPPNFFSDGEYLIKYAVEKYKSSSKRHDVASNPNGRFTFAVAERFYKPCEGFTPAVFNEKEIKSLTNKSP